MSLSIGIVGLPNVGKSTILNALTCTQAAAAENYPFCTIEPNKASVPVPDDRLQQIADVTNPEKITPTTVDFVDVAGLVRNASKNEGRGNQFLANISETDAILHVVRCFSDGNVAHVEGAPDPVRDVEIVETELLLRDIQTLENWIEKLTKQAKGDVKLRPVIAYAQEVLTHLNAGNMAASFKCEQPELRKELFTEMQFLTDKKVVYCANVDEDAAESEALVAALRVYADAKGAPVITISARMEAELIDLEEEERQEFLEGYGIVEGALPQLIRAGYEALDLISFFTVQSNQVQAWTVRRGAKAPQAAGRIHTDFEKGFIRAEVVACADLVEQGSEAACRSAGKLRTEGKDYVVQDGDVIRFLFKV